MNSMDLHRLRHSDMDALTVTERLTKALIVALTAPTREVEIDGLVQYFAAQCSESEITHAKEQALLACGDQWRQPLATTRRGLGVLSTAELGTLAAAADGLRCNCGDLCDGTCTHFELLALIERLSLPGGDA